MTGSKDYRDLVAWRKAMDLVEAAYRLTAGFPPEEKFGLTSQLRRAAVSIPSNIAEGQGRGSARDFIRFLSMAHGSTRAVETQAYIAGRLGYLTDPEVAQIITATAEVGRLINGLSRHLAERADDGQH